MCCKLRPHQFAGDGNLGMEFFVPVSGLLDEVLIDGIADQTLACLAPTARCPLCVESIQVEFERFTPLRLGERDGVTQFHALSVQGCCNKGGRIPFLYTLLDLSI